MKKTLILIFSIISVINLFSQESIFEIKAREDSMEFYEFLGYFDKVHLNEYGRYSNYFPNTYYHKFFKEKYNELIVSLYPFDILKKPNLIYLIIEIGYPQGGHTCSYQLGVFKMNGTLIKKRNIGGVMIEEMGGSDCSIEFVNDNLLESIEFEIEYNEDNDSKKIKGELEYNYYELNEFGFLSLIPKYSIDRLFSITSIRILNLDELSIYSSEQLDIMRNEIFADYGYKFKSQKWIDYFENKEWYNPRYEDVNDKLTEIEKINIDRILNIKAEKE